MVDAPVRRGVRGPPRRRSRTRTGIEPAVELKGDLDGISQSQRMALLSVVGEALNNIREHSGATRRERSRSSATRRACARACSDDGRGFDVEAELLRAARRGHMGLAGVYERVRLLGGHCRIESRPGGPSEVAIALPRWQRSPPERREPARRDAQRGAEALRGAALSRAQSAPTRPCSKA